MRCGYKNRRSAKYNFHHSFFFPLEQLWSEDVIIEYRSIKHNASYAVLNSVWIDNLNVQLTSAVDTGDGKALPRSGD